MAAAIRAMLGRMGLNPQGAQYATDRMNLNTLEQWRNYHDDDDLDGLAKSLRSPGGTTNVGGNVIRHPGYPVSVTAISNIKVMRLALKHHYLIQRAVDPATITMDWIGSWEFLVNFRKAASTKTGKEDELPTINMKDWARTKEMITTHFTEIFGQEGVPLAYLLRDDAAVPAEADDPQANYDEDHIQELITRAPHTGTSYRSDNRTFLRFLKKMCADTPAYTHISSIKNDGRRAWLKLMQVYLGPQHTQNQATIYEHKLQNSRYNGESSRFTFDKLTDIHKEAHTRLQALEAYGYQGIDEGTKIRYLLNAITDPSLKTVKELIRGNPAFTTFDEAVRRIKDTIVSEAPNNKRLRTIASLQKNDDIKPDMNVQDTYYNKKDWAKLTPAQRKGVLLKRKQRQGAGGGGGGGGGDPPKSKDLSKTNKRLKRKVAKLTKKLAATTVTNGDNNSASGSDSEEETARKSKKSKTNRTHPSTNRGGQRS